MIGSRAFAPFAMPKVEGTPPIYDPREVWAVSGADPSASASIGEQVAGARQNSVWDRLGGVLQEPGMSAALLRASAAAFNGGGLGGAIQAGAGYMDDQKAIAARGQQQQFTNELALRDANLAELRQQQANDLGWAGVTNQALGIEETGRHNRAAEGLDANGQRIQLHGIDTQAATTQRGQNVQLVTNAADNAQSDRNNQRSTDANIYGTNVGFLADGQRAKAAGIGSKAAGYTETKTKTPARNPWFGPSTPASETTTRIPMLPPVTAPQATPAPASAIAALKSNPNLATQFEAKYGAGSAAQYLGGR